MAAVTTRWTTAVGLSVEATERDARADEADRDSDSQSLTIGSAQMCGTKLPRSEGHERRPGKNPVYLELTEGTALKHLEEHVLGSPRSRPGA